MINVKDTTKKVKAAFTRNPDEANIPNVTRSSLNTTTGYPGAVVKPLTLAPKPPRPRKVRYATQFTK